MSAVILRLQSGASVGSPIDKLLNKLSIGRVRVQIVLRRLDLVHMLVGRLVGGDLLRLNAVKVLFLRVDRRDWDITAQLLVDLHSVGVVALVECLGERIDLVLQVRLADLEASIASLVDHGCRQLAVPGGKVAMGVFGDGGDAANKNCFHLTD